MKYGNVGGNALRLFGLECRAEDEFIVREVWSGIYEREAQVQPGDVVVDAGAHIGSFSVKVAGIASRVIAFEPEPSNFELLTLNTSIIKNIEIHREALWSIPGRMRLYHNKNNTGGHNLLLSTLLLEGVTDYGLDVDVTSLDELLNLEINFIKMDIEGSEIWALKGASKLLERYHPVVVLEAHPIEPLENWWRSLTEVLPGYELRPTPTPSDMWCRKIVTALPASTLRCA